MLDIIKLLLLRLFLLSLQKKVSWGHHAIELGFNQGPSAAAHGALLYVAENKMYDRDVTSSNLDLIKLLEARPMVVLRKKVVLWGRHPVELGFNQPP